MIDPGLLNLLCCPETHQRLTPAEAALIQALNAQIAAGQLRNRAGAIVTRPCDGGLIRQDGRYLYPICQEIPVLLIDEALPLPAEAAQATAGG